jgi:hypothetical protein
MKHAATLSASICKYDHESNAFEKMGMPFVLEKGGSIMLFSTG